MGSHLNRSSYIRCHWVRIKWFEPKCNEQWFQQIFSLSWICKWKLDKISQAQWKQVNTMLHLKWVELSLGMWPAGRRNPASKLRAKFRRKYQFECLSMCCLMSLCDELWVNYCKFLEIWFIAQSSKLMVKSFSLQHTFKTIKDDPGCEAIYVPRPQWCESKMQCFRWPVSKLKKISGQHQNADRKFGQLKAFGLPRMDQKNWNEIGHAPPRFQQFFPTRGSICMYSSVCC